MLSLVSLPIREEHLHHETCSFGHSFKMRRLSFATVTTAVQSRDSSPVGPGGFGGGGGGGDLTHKRPGQHAKVTLFSCRGHPGDTRPLTGLLAHRALWTRRSGAAAADRPSPLINAVLPSL